MLTPAVDQLRQALNSGHIGPDEARSLCENAPRLVKMLCEGLYPQLLTVTPRDFVLAAKAGQLTNERIERALS
jgi:tape measure domain-containing protein